MRKTNEQFVQELALKNSNIIPLEKYIKSYVPILVKCNIDGHEWKARPNDLLRGHGCPKCKSNKIGNLKRNSLKNIKEILSKKNIELLDNNYINNKTNILVRCTICNHQWFTRLDRTLYNSGCPKCANIKKAEDRTLSQEEFNQRIYKLSPELEILGKYINSKSPIKCKCTKCNYIWDPCASSLLVGSSCPNCKHSKGEKFITSYLKEHNINYQEQYKADSNNFSNRNHIKVDFYLPDHNLFIEYNGIQHYIPQKHFGGEIKFKDQQERDE